MVEWSDISLIVTLLGLSGGILATYFKGILKINSDLAALELRLNQRHADTCTKISEIDVKVSVFWKYLESHLPNMLKRPTHFEMDQLLDKFRLRTITQDETIKLRDFVEKLLADDMLGKREMCLADILMLGLIDVRLKEFDFKLK